MSSTLSSTEPSGSNYPWKFFRAGGVDQVTLRHGADITNLERLNQKLWVALACPTRGIEFDTRTLDLIDTDKDGRVRAPEILAAIRWVKDVLRNTDELLKGGDSVPLSSINDQTPTGAALLAGAKRILQNLDKPTATSISLTDVGDTAKIFSATKFNGDGVVPADSAGDDATRKVIEEIMATHGSVPDRSAKPGVNQAKADAFFTEATAWQDWQAKSQADAAILPLGETTAAASAAARAVKVKVDDYFARCRLAAFDARAAGPMNRAEAEFTALALKDLTHHTEEIAKLPLARVEAGRPLPLVEGLNPAWAGAVAEFVANAVTPLLGGSKVILTESDWQAVQTKLASYEVWMASKPATSVEKLGWARIQEILAGKAKANVTSLVQQDAALEAENAQIAAVEKMLYFQRDLYKLLNNFVNFSEFYGRKGAVFQAGTLYLDGRSCNLCVHVADAGKHGTMAGLSAAYLAYCDCTRPGGEKMTVAAAFTDGDSDRLIVGRNGVFYDRKGRDWDATITKIVANPISIREAFWSPYKKFVRMIEEMVAKRATAAEAESQAKLAGAASAVATADKAKPAEPKKLDIGTVAAIGVAVGGIGALVTGVLGTFFGLGMWMPLGLIAIVILISGPSMLLAFLKLRQRNLGPILDANGWAINGRAKINVPFGRALTDMALLPPGSERSMEDPYAEKSSPWKTYVVLILIVVLGFLWYVGKLDRYMPGKVKSTSVLGANAPAYRPAPALPAPVASEKPATP